MFGAAGRLCRSFTGLPKSNFFLNKSKFFSSATVVKRVGTHNGKFHCDEALACFMIRCTDRFSGAQIIRTRDPEVLETLDAVLDVGGIYDPTRDRYDHHQAGFEEIFSNGFRTKLSSAGLVYKHYGEDIIAKEIKLDCSHPNVKQLYIAIYKNFIEAIDAIDNGIREYNTKKSPKYINNTDLSSRVNRLNLNYLDTDQSIERENMAFQQAMALSGSELLESIHFHAKSWLPARSIVKDSIMARKDVDSSGEIMVLSRSCPWKLHIFELEEEMKIGSSIKYVIYQDDRSQKWRVQAVAVSPGKFESRKPLPSSWRGLNDEELSKVAGISDCTFVHSSGFIGGNRNYEGVLSMARTSLVTS
ncbi:MYG1 protein-like [Impatiens glandulifera]|uniref:MYG1 protein-like n=1 Tax=Impatiens glandulifera TaxID=253017 RepID=UPI001FB18CE5|nr:MYG1 protein-like [Impatiens glandulifera]